MFKNLKDLIETRKKVIALKELSNSLQYEIDGQCSVISAQNTHIDDLEIQLEQVNRSIQGRRKILHKLISEILKTPTVKKSVTKKPAPKKAATKKAVKKTK